jgi:hypothetical protein
VPPVRAIDRLPVRYQRVESGGLAIVAAVAFVELGHSWWWLLGYGLKFQDRFTHTHLGEICKQQPTD